MPLWHNLGLGVTDYIHGNLPYFTFEAGTLLAVLGVVAIVRHAGIAGIATLGVFMLLFASTLASRTFAPGHYHYWERWLVPSFPGLLLAMAAGLGMIASRSGIRIAAAAIGAVLLLAAVPRVLSERAHTFAWNCQNIDEVNVALGRWIDQNLPRDAVVAVNDAGALRFFGNRVTLDLVGLNDHRVRRALAERRGAQLLIDSHVGWLVVFPPYFRDLIAQPGVAPVHEARSPHYTVSAADQDVMVVFRWDRTR